MRLQYRLQHRTQCVLRKCYLCIYSTDAELVNEEQGRIWLTVLKHLLWRLKSSNIRLPFLHGHSLTEISDLTQIWERTEGMGPEQHVILFIRMNGQQYQPAIELKNGLCGPKPVTWQPQADRNFSTFKGSVSEVNPNYTLTLHLRSFSVHLFFFYICFLGQLKQLHTPSVPKHWIFFPLWQNGHKHQ